MRNVLCQFKCNSVAISCGWSGGKLVTITKCLLRSLPFRSLNQMSEIIYIEGRRNATTTRFLSLSSESRLLRNPKQEVTVWPISLLRPSDALINWIYFFFFLLTSLHSLHLPSTEHLTLLTLGRLTEWKSLLHSTSWGDWCWLMMTTKMTVDRQRLTVEGWRVFTEDRTKEGAEGELLSPCYLQYYLGVLYGNRKLDLLREEGENWPNNPPIPLSLVREVYIL